MTTKAPENSAPGTKATEGRSGGWADAAPRLAFRLAQTGFRPGDLAELRRMEPDRADSPVLIGLLAQEDLFGSPQVVKKWALIVHGMALMTPKGSSDAQRGTAHDGMMPVGRALFLGGEATRDQGFYSEARLKRLLASRGDMTRTLLARAFRMLAANGVTLNWREMARFILSDGYNKEWAEESRRRIASDYFRAQYQSGRDSSDND